MGKSALKAVGVFLSRRRLSKQHADRTLSIAIVVTLVALRRHAVYLMQGTPGFPGTRSSAIRSVRAPPRRWRRRVSGVLSRRCSPGLAPRRSQHLVRRLGGVIHRRYHLIQDHFVFARGLWRPRFGFFRRSFLWRRRSYCVAIEARPLELVADEPGAQQASDLVVIENVRVDRVDRHDRSAGFQDDKIARLENGHQRNPGSKRQMIATMAATISDRVMSFVAINGDEHALGHHVAIAALIVVPPSHTRNISVTSDVRSQRVLFF